MKNPPAVEVAKDMIGKTTICQFCHQVSCFIGYKDILLSLFFFQIQGETKDILQSGRLYKLSINGSKSVEFYHYFCLLFR